MSTDISSPDQYDNTPYPIRCFNCSKSRTMATNRTGFQRALRGVYKDSLQLLNCISQGGRHSRRRSPYITSDVTKVQQRNAPCSDPIHHWSEDHNVNDLRKRSCVVERRGIRADHPLSSRADFGPSEGKCSLTVWKRVQVKISARNARMGVSMFPRTVAVR